MEIELINVSKQFKDKKVLENISFKIIDETLVISGESGKGKTTLIRLISLLDKPTSGEIKFSIDKKKMRIGFVFQENRLSENFNAIENVRMILNDKTITNNDIIKELTNLLPEEDLFKKVSEFSGGMKRRLCIVMAIMSNPDYYIMDEPFAGLDEVTTLKVVNYIKEKTKGKILILAIHKNDYFKGVKEISV